MTQISLFVIAKARTLLLAYFQKSSASKIANSELLYILSTVKFSLAKKKARTTTNNVKQHQQQT